MDTEEKGYINEVLQEYLCQGYAMTFLQWLSEHQLYFKAEKCTFHQSSIQFLGYHISEQEIKMDKGKSVESKSKSLSWTLVAAAAMKTLHEVFMLASLLVHPDPQKPFIIEDDASTSGVGAVLSQQQGNPPRLHSCPLFSWKLSPLEQNYDIGNRELVTIKLAFEKWRHWLKGARQPFVAEYTKLSPSTIHGSHSRPVRTHLSATPVVLLSRILGGTIGYSLDPGEREGLGLSSSTSPESSATPSASTFTHHHSAL
ncbi:Transposon Tf2-6 polyprotein [Labeo rohita]|uniref:Transposon Tf2-6 polyprotein n=1 Tax=Labeo rohita TaxID=84645 RepID=A0ABQ8L6J1_LABRO|nr:Transposon Tf2-6 polyprotein [Labeo rohita]